MNIEEINAVLSSFHFANMVWVLIIPCVLMAVDFAAGLLNAWLKGEVKSAKMRNGLGKKIGELVILLLGELFSYGMGLPKGLLEGVSLYIILMELLSIFENLAKLGVPIPSFFSKALEDASENINNGSFLTGGHYKSAEEVGSKELKVEPSEPEVIEDEEESVSEVEPKEHSLTTSGEASGETTEGGENNETYD